MFTELGHLPVSLWGVGDERIANYIRRAPQNLTIYQSLLYEGNRTNTGRE